MTQATVDMIEVIGMAIFLVCAGIVLSAAVIAIANALPIIHEHTSKKKER